MVVLFHVPTTGFIASLPIVKNSFLFVDFFFVLSGFVIGIRYGQGLTRGDSLLTFLWNRFARLYPLHLAMLALFLLFELGLVALGPISGFREPFEGSYSVKAFLQSLCFLQIWWASAAVWNVPSWSVAAEWWVYLVFGLGLRFAGRWLIPICATAALCAPLYLGLRGEQYLNVMNDGAFARAMGGFSVGLLGWRALARVEGWRLPVAVDTALEVAALMAVVTFVSLAGQGWPSLAAPLLFLVAVLLFAREKGPVSRLLRYRPLRKVGLWSYSIYLIHMFLVYRLVNVIGLIGMIAGYDLVEAQGGDKAIGGGALFGDAVTLLFLALVIYLARLSYLHIEEPGRLLLRDRVRLRRPAFAAAP